MDRKCCFGPADIALPDFRKTDGTSWAVVACDQFTSEPEYWEAADRLVGPTKGRKGIVLTHLGGFETGTCRG